jgi:hypothetical protein
MNNTLLQEQSVPVPENNKKDNNEKDKIYESSSLGISFNYSSNLFVEESSEILYVTNIPASDPKRKSSAMMGALSIVLMEGKTLEDAVQALVQEILSQKEFSLDGHRATEITSNPDGYSGSTWIFLLVETQKGILKIQYLKDSAQVKEYENIIPSIHFQ